MVKMRALYKMFSYCCSFGVSLFAGLDYILDWSFSTKNYFMSYDLTRVQVKLEAIYMYIILPCKHGIFLPYAILTTEVSKCKSNCLIGRYI